MRNLLSTFSLLVGLLMCGQALAQQPSPPPFKQPSYGESIDLDQAKKVAAAAASEAKKNNWSMSISVVGISGELVYFEHMDNTSYASIDLSIHKARTTARFRSPTRRFSERLAAGPVNSYLTTFDGMIAGPGGNLIMVGNKIVGAIGASGSTGAHDEQVSAVGANALK